MSSPVHYHPAAWRPDRLRIACHARGLVDAADRPCVTAVTMLVNRHRAQRDAAPVARNTVMRWLAGSCDPSRGRTGHDCSIYEIADALGVSLDWLMGRTEFEHSISAREVVNAMAAELRAAEVQP